jgi:hypothetical protein
MQNLKQIHPVNAAMFLAGRQKNTHNEANDGRILATYTL